MKKYDINKLNEIDIKYLDEIGQQTKYKVKLVKSYAEQWLLVSVNRKNVKNINYIDCMCNAGIYKRGEFCSCIEIINSFIGFANQNKEKEFNIYLNDVNKNKIEILNKLINELFNDIPRNLTIYINNYDVNLYLSQYSFEDKLIYESSNLLFVDPYNLGTVKINIMSEFVHKHYCDLLFNYFISDFRRNGLDKKKRFAIEENVGCEDDVYRSIERRLKQKNIKYVYTYEFRNRNNNALYQILFATPNRKGLIKFKEVIWAVFNGNSYYINFDEREQSLFDDMQYRKMNIESYAKQSINKLLLEFGNREVDFNEIEDYVLLKTPLSDSHIINCIIKPAIEKELIIKKNLTSKRNYKKDRYYIKNENNN